jgi:hypothetical protein
MMSNASILGFFIIAMVSFFWGTYKAMKTQETRYLLATIPFILLILGMFLL